MFRTKTIDESISYEEKGEGHMLITYQPGNMTRYVLIFQKLSFIGGAEARQQTGTQHGTWLVSNVADSRNINTMLVVENNGFLHYSYVEEKMGVGTGDAVVLAEIIGEKLGRSYETSESVRISMMEVAS